MPENLFKQFIDNEISLETILTWITNGNLETLEINCNRHDFMNYFLKQLHQSVYSETKDERRRRSAPSTLTKKTNRTPLRSHPSPVHSPKFNQSPDSGRPSSLRLGHFITPSPRKTPPRRINPTKLVRRLSDDFSQNANRYDFTKNCGVELDIGAESNRVQQTLTLPPENNDLIGLEAESNDNNLDFLNEKPKNPKKLNELIEIYHCFFKTNQINCYLNELRFVLTLILQWRRYSGRSYKEDTPIFWILSNPIDWLYFAAKSLDIFVEVLPLLDDAIIIALSNNVILEHFGSGLVANIVGHSDWLPVDPQTTPNDMVCFNVDTDNRTNFPTAPSFHAFCRQRDTFYDILRNWQHKHHAIGWNFDHALGRKIQYLLTSNQNATNYHHLARLFKDQLLKGSSNSSPTRPDVPHCDWSRLNRLETRLVGGRVNVDDDFFMEFINSANHHAFNMHLIDVIIADITDTMDVGVGDGIDRGLVERVRRTRRLAKILAHIESGPYHDLIGSHQIVTKRPSFDCRLLLEESLKAGTLTVCVPWLVEYLTNLAHIQLKLSYYTTLIGRLHSIHKSISTANHSPEIFLIRCCLNRLYNHVNPPINDQIMDESINLIGVHFVTRPLLYECCPELDELKTLLTPSVGDNVSTLTLKHITPISAVQTTSGARLQRHLTSAFYDGLPSNIRKCVDFVVERTLTTYIKCVNETLLPRIKKEFIETRRNDVSNDSACLKALQSARDECTHALADVIDGRIEKMLDVLLESDEVAPRVRLVLVGLAKRDCRQRALQWMENNVTLYILMKNYDNEMKNENKKDKRNYRLLSENLEHSHNPDTYSPFHLIDYIRGFSVEILEKHAICRSDYETLLNDTVLTFTQRNDINSAIFTSLMTSLIDLHLFLITHHLELIDDTIRDKFYDILKMALDDVHLEHLLTHRNVMLLMQSNDRETTWRVFARFCADLLTRHLLSVEKFESQCAGLFAHEWDDIILERLTTFFREFIAIYQQNNGIMNDKFVYLLEFLSDYCQDLS